MSASAVTAFELKEIIYVMKSGVTLYLWGRSFVHPEGVQSDHEAQFNNSYECGDISKNSDKIWASCFLHLLYMNGKEVFSVVFIILSDAIV